MAIRLNKVLRECNIGLQVAVAFLHKKGFVEVEENPNIKISDEQYQMLVEEFVEKRHVTNDSFVWKHPREKMSSEARGKTQENSNTRSTNQKKPGNEGCAYDVFISYRRNGGDKYARTIQQALAKDYRVFLDFDELEDGVFDQRIIDAICGSSVFLLILSKGALDRCVNEDDWVRLEIQEAVKSGCHMVPVTIIGEGFTQMPDGLPDEIYRAVAPHQFSQLHMETLFKESMCKLIRTRIAPYVNKKLADTGAEIHIETDADCQLLHFKKALAQIYINQDNVIHLKRGRHKILFVSSEYEDITIEHILEIPADNYTDFIKIEIKDRIESRRKLEESKFRAKRLTLLENRDLKCISKAEKYGYVDAQTGEVIIPCEWDFASDFSEGLACVEKIKFGFINKHGNEVIPLKYNNASNFNEGMACVQDDDGKWGFVDKTGDLVIPCEWDYANDFNSGLALVKDNGDKWYFIAETGEIVIHCEWNQVRSFSEGLAVIKNDNGMCGFINRNGEVVIPCKWRNVYDFSDGLARVQDDDGKWGFVDQTGEVVISCEWNAAESFSDGLAQVMNGSCDIFFIDKSGKIVFTCKSCYCVESFKEGLARVCYIDNDENERWGFIDKTGEEVIPCEWDVAYDFSNGLARVMNEKWETFFIDKAGTVIISGSEAGDFSEGLSVLGLGDYSEGYMDKLGKVTIPCDEWDEAYPFHEGYACVAGTRPCVINKLGELVIPYKWRSVGDFCDGLACVQDDDGKWGFINKTGELVIPCEWDDAESFSDGLAQVYGNGDWYYIDKNGNIVQKTMS